MRRSMLAAILLAVFLLAPVAAPDGAARAQTAALPSREMQALQDETARLYRAGDYARALAVAEKALALAIAEAGPDHERVAIQTYSVGLVAESAGQLALAEQRYRDSIRVREKVYGVDSAGASQGLEKLGGVLLRTGRLAEAEAVFERVLKIRGGLVGGDHSYTAGTRADLGTVQLARGNFTAALGHFRDAVRLLTSQRTTQTLARSVIDDEIRRHRSAFAGLAHAAWEAGRQPQGGVGAALMAESFAASQQAWSTSAASALARMSARIGAGDTDLGRRIRRSQDTAERILALHEEDMKALAAWDEIGRKSPEYAAALEAFRQASIAQGRDNAPVVARQKELVAALQAHLKRCPPGQRPAGCEAADKEREAITRELGQLAQSAARGSGDLMALHKRMQTAEAALPGHAEFSARRDARLAESQRLETALAEERAAILRSFPDYAALTEPRPLGISETQALLQPDEALVTILVGPSRSFVWAITRERAEWAPVEAGADALAVQVEALRRGLDPLAAEPATPGGAAVTPGFDLARAHALYRLILGPVAHVLAGRQHLMVVPTGPLSSLPFQVLVAEPPQPGLAAAQAVRSAQWLIRRHALSVLPSVQSLAALRRLAPAGQPARPFLGVGDPVLTGPQAPPAPQQRGKTVAAANPAQVYRNGAADLRAVRELAPLPETADELKAIAKVLGADASTLMLRAEATEARFKRTRLDDYRIVHFATHGLVAGELSGLAEPALVMTPPDAPSDVDDGLLTASEVATLRLAADWVVLSACNTASGTASGAEALSGLARAFFYAGARGLLVSHWSVHSDAAVLLTTRTFEALAREPGIGRAEAFRRTMLGLVDAGRPPSYWAPFVIVGEGGRGR